MMDKKILIINGPNLNMLGLREPDIYGNRTLSEINSGIQSYASGMRITCEFFQSNIEGEIIDKIQSVFDKYDGCIINAGAYSHYSYAIRDAVSCSLKPFIEVHMSNIYNREQFRKESVISPVCNGVIAGFGMDSYLLAISAMRDLLK